MVDRLALTADHSRPAAILRIAGELRLANARQVETAAMKLFAEARVGLVLDVSDLRVGDELGLLIIPVIARRAEREHGLRVALAGVPPPVGLRLHQLGVGSIERFDTAARAQAGLSVTRRPGRSPRTCPSTSAPPNKPAPLWNTPVTAGDTARSRKTRLSSCPSW